ncbi:hypothetical protein H9Q08_10350 [Chryseobacterium sp. PS-8]|uniref:Uncharacterized protein n=1 Tax=Chryseobacterium indicum TaxID=2766954 RepID=A0ABS9C583_9FLAO|nr:hypothetical protein [Chryseobacterium sp. PS-8]MCF2219709.1 hypothetical protein [Chryseobacterium sp. PS-8]
MKDSHIEYIGDEIFDFEREALSFIQKKICTTLKISPSTFRDYKKHFIQDTNVIFEINTKVNKVDDTLEVLISPIKYAIRNEDIKLLDAILSGLTAAVSVNFFQGHHENSKTISGQDTNKKSPSIS